MSVNFTDNVYLFTPGVVGITSTRTSEAQDVSKRDRITLVFTASSISTGNGVFTLDASNDNSYWATGIAFQSAGAVGVTTTPGVNSATLSKNGTWGAIVDPGWQYIRGKVTVSTNGRYNIILHSQG